MSGQVPKSLGFITVEDQIVFIGIQRCAKILFGKVTEDDLYVFSQMELESVLRIPPRSSLRDLLQSRIV